MIKHNKLTFTGLATLTTQIQKLVSYCNKNKGVVAADPCAEVEKIYVELPTLDKNAGAIVAIITDSERLMHLLMRKKRHHSQTS